MASRREQKEAARARRLAAERAAAEQRGRRDRLRLLAGVVVLAVVIVVVAIVVSSRHGGAVTRPDSAAARMADAHVTQLLHGIPQSGDRLGRPDAPVTVTEYGDLECSVCDMLAAPPSVTNPENESGTGLEDELIDRDVRSGEVRLVYRSLETASESNPDPGAFALQQQAAVAAGLQGRAWNFIELFYNEQGPEGSGYVTDRYLEGLARQIPGLDLARWMTDRTRSSVRAQVTADNASGTAVDDGHASTPTLVIQGPDGRRILPPGLPSGFGELQAAIRAVD